MNIKYHLRSIKWMIWNFLYYKSPIYIEFKFLKIYRYYWSARKYFLKPIIIKHKLKRGDSLGSDYYYLDTNVNNKWFHLSFESCGWKDKFREVRFESVPYILLVIFNKVWVWGFEAPLYEQYRKTWQRNNMLYWEGVLSFSINYSKNILSTYKNNIWVRTYTIINHKKEEERLEIQETIFNALTEYGKQIIKSHYDFLAKLPPPKPPKIK